jgi:hypothetical protein
VANSYTNMKFGARILEVGAKEVVAQGIAHDLENNVSTSVEVRRRITTSKGKRYGDDMIAVTCNAACSIALRNAIFKAVPFALFKGIYEQAKKVAIGDAKTLNERRAKMIAAFAQMSVPKERILESLGVAGVDDINLTHMETLLGQYNAIKDGEVSVDEQFPDPNRRQTAADKTAVAASTNGEVAHNVEEQAEVTKLKEEARSYGLNKDVAAICHANGTNYQAIKQQLEILLIRYAERQSENEPVVIEGLETK